MLKAVLFDMDGVLVDSEPVHFAANSKMMQETFGIELIYDDYRKFIGSTIEKIWKFYREKYNLLDYDWSELMEKAESVLYAMVEKNGYPEIEGTKNIIKELKNKGYQLAVASSSPMAKILRNLETLGITQYFDVMVSGMEVENPKPAPDIFLKAAESLGVEPDECIVIEDSRNGVLAAKAAGMAALGFVNPNSGNQDLSDADYLFEDFKNIDEAFIRMVHNHCFGIPWTVITTERLVIREITVDDIDSLIRIYEPEEITRYMEKLYPREQEIQYIRDYISNIYRFYGYGMWIVETKDGKVIGRAGIEYLSENICDKNEITGRHELAKNAVSENQDSENADNIKDEGLHLLGYVIDKDYQHMGYAYEACDAVIRYAKEQLFLETLYVKIHKDNVASIALAKKLGFEI